MSKRRATYLGERVVEGFTTTLENGEVIGGEDIVVKIYGQANSDPDPAFPFDFAFVAANLDTLSTEEVRDYQDKLQAWRDDLDYVAPPKFDADLDFLGSDEFFGTAEENAIAANAEYLEETDESFKPLTEMLEELGIE